MAINTALQNQTCFNRQDRSVRSTSIDCSGPRYCLLNAGMNLNELQFIAAGRVIVCLTQDPRVVSRHQHDCSGVKRIDSARCSEIARRCIVRHGMRKAPIFIPGLVSDNPTDGCSMRWLEGSLWQTVSSLHKKQRTSVRSVHFIKCTGQTWELPQGLQSTPKGGQSLLRSWEALRRR